jgi:hypothetical protein
LPPTQSLTKQHLQPPTATTTTATATNPPAGGIVHQVMLEIDAEPRPAKSRPDDEKDASFKIKHPVMHEMAVMYEIAEIKNI